MERRDFRLKLVSNADLEIWLYCCFCFLCGLLLGPFILMGLQVPPISSFYSSRRLSLDNPSIFMNSSPYCKIYTSSLDSSLEPQMPLHIGLSHPVGTQRPRGQFDWHFIHPFPHPVYFIILYSLSEVLAPLAKQIWNREVTFASSFIPNKSHSLNH